MAKLGFKVLLPTLGVGLLGFKLNSSPRPELFSSLIPGVPNAKVSLECPTTPKSAWSAHPRIAQRVPEKGARPQSLPPGGPWSAQTPASRAQPQSFSGVPNPRVSCPTPLSQSAQPQSLSGVPSFVPTLWSAQPEILVPNPIEVKCFSILLPSNPNP